jgi:hypothetical protein
VRAATGFGDGSPETGETATAPGAKPRSESVATTAVIVLLMPTSLSRWGIDRPRSARNSILPLAVVG